MTSPLQTAKRQFVKLLLTIAAAYGIVLGITRDSGDSDVSSAYRKVMRKAHPDKGGNVQDAKRLNDAKDIWEKAKTEPSNKGGRPRKQQRPADDSQNRSPNSNQNTSPNDSQNTSSNPNTDQGLAECADPEEVFRTYRFQSLGILLTYNGIGDKAQWHRFLSFVKAHLKTWGVRFWCATLEKCKNGRLHVHLYIQFHTAKDRTTAPYRFEGIRPRADPNDYLGEGINKRYPQPSLNRGFFYVWADKIGTERNEDGSPCVAGNYAPCWTKTRCTYEVLGRWPEKLWKARKLTTKQYDEFLFLSRDGVIGRKRNLDACVQREREDAQAAEMSARAKRFRANPALFVPFPTVPDAVKWLDRFKVDALRYPILFALGPSHTGKTEWAQSLFKNPLVVGIGKLETFPEGFRSFDRETHDGIVLDDVRDLEWVSDYQDKLQGRYNNLVEFASTQGGTRAYFCDMFCIPIVVTINFSTKNLGYLETHDWLGKPENRSIVYFPLPGFAPPPPAGGA